MTSLSESRISPSTAKVEIRSSEGKTLVFLNGKEIGNMVTSLKMEIHSFEMPTVTISLRAAELVVDGKNVTIKADKINKKGRLKP